MYQILAKNKKNFNGSLPEEVVESFFRGSFSCCIGMLKQRSYSLIQERKNQAEIIPT